MKRYFTGGLALLLALNLALPGSTVTLAEDMATSSDMDASMPTATATAMPTATATAMPTATATAAPTAEATAVPTATATPEVAANGPAYYLEGETRRYGELAELIPLAQALGQPVYLASAKVYELPGWTLEQASDLALALDTTVFPEENRVVMLSETNPAGNSAENTVYLWVGFKLPVEEGSNGGESQEILEMELQVTPQNYDESNPCTPTFTLAAIPELTQGQTYGVELDGVQAQPLEGNTYTPDASGSYRFVVLDEAGEVLARSRAWAVTLSSGSDTAPTATPTAEPAANSTATPTAEPAVEPTATPTAEPAANSTATPTAEPAANSTATPTAEPAVEPTATPTAEPAANSTATPTAEPAVEPTATPTAEPDVNPTATPTSEIAPVPTEQPEVLPEPELLVAAVDYTPDTLSDAAPTFILSGITGEDWYYAVSVDDAAPMALVGDRYTATASGTYTLRFYMMDDDGQTLATSAPYTVRLDFTTESSIRKQAWMGNPDGSGPVYGTLEGLLALAPTGSTIYLLTGDIIILSGGASQLSGVQLAADPGVFATSSCAVRVTTQSPLDGSAGLFVYVEEVTAGEETATLTLQAACDQVLDGSWLTTAPTFTLSSDVELPQGWTWAVRYDGGAPVTLAGNTFTAQEEGAYTLTFVVLDGAGQVAASTQDVTLQLDTTPPLVQATAGANLTLTVTASDAVSGIDGLSMDGGASWYPVTEMGEGVWGLTFTAAQAYTFAPGTIVARDGAGNLAAYEKEVTLQSSQGRPSGGFSGGGGGGSSSTVATTHATSDTTAVVAYDGVELVVADQPMSSLVMGETELELFLRPDESLLARLGEDYQPAFTATLSNWMEDATDTPDTLVLAVSQEDLAQAEDAAFTWDFNGTVYKKLAASGIDYLVLQVGDQVTALSTAGFAAGVRYTMYRAQGLSSEAFDYHVAMTEEGETTLSVTVAGETWLLTEEEGGAFYYYDVYTGTLEELAQAKEG